MLEQLFTLFPAKTLGELEFHNHIMNIIEKEPVKYLVLSFFLGNKNKTKGLQDIREINNNKPNKVKEV